MGVLGRHPKSLGPPILISPLCLPSSGPVTTGRNPCADRNGGCAHTCRVLQGLAHCACHAGHLLAADRKACEGETPPCTPAPPQTSCAVTGVPLGPLHRPRGAGLARHHPGLTWEPPAGGEGGAGVTQGAASTLSRSFVQSGGVCICKYFSCHLCRTRWVGRQKGDGEEDGGRSARSQGWPLCVSPASRAFCQPQLACTLRGGQLSQAPLSRRCF